MATSHTHGLMAGTVAHAALPRAGGWINVWSGNSGPRHTGGCRRSGSLRLRQPLHDHHGKSRDQYRRAPHHAAGHGDGLIGGRRIEATASAMLPADRRIEIVDAVRLRPDPDLAPAPAHERRRPRPPRSATSRATSFSATSSRAIRDNLRTGRRSNDRKAGRMALQSGNHVSVSVPPLKHINGRGSMVPGCGSPQQCCRQMAGCSG